jgi:hypothetical protein
MAWPRKVVLCVSTVIARNLPQLSNTWCEEDGLLPVLRALDATFLCFYDATSACDAGSEFRVYVEGLQGNGTRGLE